MSPAVMLLAWITYLALSVYPQAQQPDVTSDAASSTSVVQSAVASASGSVNASSSSSPQSTTFVIVTGAPSSAAATSTPVASGNSSAAPATTTVTLVVSNHTNPLYTYNYTSGIKINDTSIGVNNSFSAPFYPSPETRGAGNWTYAVEKARLFVSNLTLEEKVNLTTGVGWTGGRCVGNIPAIERVGFNGLCLQDAPLGVRMTDGVTAFPSGLNAAATFDRHLMYERALAIGEEFRGKGVNIALGPGMNGGGRVAESGMCRSTIPWLHANPSLIGRQWEMGGGDPYLAGESAYYAVKGLQDAGVQACAKHYILNEQERNRTTSSSNSDDQTIHEIYLHPFLRSVQADVATVYVDLVDWEMSC